MPENLHDSAASFDENQKYMDDPTAPEGKEYSTKQKAANAEHRSGRAMLYHEDGPAGGRVFEGHEVEAAMADGWCDVPFVHPNNPDHQPPVVEVEQAQDDSTADMDALWAEVDRLNIRPRPHPMTGRDKLMKLIEEADDG